MWGIQLHMPPPSPNHKPLDIQRCISQFAPLLRCDHAGWRRETPPNFLAMDGLGHYAMSAFGLQHAQARQHRLA
jgi:hypothetical protein